MSQSMNTTAGRVGDLAPPSNNRWWAIVAGIGLAAVLGYGAALVATDHLPGADHAATAVVVAATPREIERRAVVQSALDPFEVQAASPQTQAAAGATGLSPQEITQLRGEAMAGYFAAQSLSSASVQSYAGADDLATRSSAVGAGAIIEQSILDALEERSVAVSPAAAGTMWGTEFSDPSELYPSVAGASGVVAHGALDPFEERRGSLEAQAATGTAGASSEEFTRSLGNSTVGYFDGSWHSVGDPTESAESLSQPTVAYFDGQWHSIEVPGKYSTPEFR